MNSRPLPPLCLSFGPADPTGASGVQADLLTAAALGAHMLSVLTAWLVQDSAALESANALAPEQIDDQARSLLEDMTVSAFKVGALYRPETVAVVASILADYSAAPVVLHLGAESAFGSAGPSAESEDLDEVTVQASLDLLVPQAELVVVEHARLEHWFAEGWLQAQGAETAAQALLALGPQHVLITGVPHAGESPVNVLAGQSPKAEAWSWQRLPAVFLGAGTTLTAALTALLARQSPVRQAVIDAQQFTRHALEAAYRPGMGRCFPDRQYWRSTDDS